MKNIDVSSEKLFYRLNQNPRHTYKLCSKSLSTLFAAAVLMGYAG